MRIALAHDYLIQLGGAERVLDAFRELWPNAPIFASVYDKKTTESRYADADVRCSSLQRMYGDSRLYKFALGKFSGAFEEFDFSEFDVVLSSSSAFAKGVVTGPKTIHVCYCHTPARLAWQFHSYVGQAGMGSVMEKHLRSQARKLRLWDVTSASRVDRFIANSFNVAAKIKKYYGRESDVVQAPVDCHRFAPSHSPHEDFYLMVGRMIAYKRMDVAVEAFTRLGKRLVVVGSGPHERKLRSIAGSSVEFLGRLPDCEVAKLYSKCRAFLFTGEEDFGITPLEAMASGRPVIAFRAGGALETVVDGKTGVFFDRQSSSSLIPAVRNFEALAFDAQELRSHAESFDVGVFKSKIAKIVDDALSPANAHSRPALMREMSPFF